MTALRTAAQQALEAMDYLHRTGDTQVFDLCHRETTEALRAALAEPVQEPVAWRTQNATPPGGYVVFQQYPQGVVDLGGVVEPLYTAPPQPEERNFCPRCGKRTNDIHTCTPP